MELDWGRKSYTMYEKKKAVEKAKEVLPGSYVK